jgi:hypothetical protein
MVRGPKVGVEVPMPTLPAWVTVTNCVPVEEAIPNGLVPAVPWTKRVDVGVMVPIPTFPEEVILIFSVSELRDVLAATAPAV